MFFPGNSNNKGIIMATIQARVDYTLWEKLKNRLRTKTNQDTVIKMMSEYDRLWKENQNLQLKLTCTKMSLKTLKERGAG